MWLRPSAVQHLQGLDGLLQDLPLGGVGDVWSSRAKRGSSPLLNGLGDVAHQGVEGLVTVYQAHGKHQLRVLLVLHLDRDLVLGEHVPGAEPELEGVSQVDGHGDVAGEAIFDGGLDRGLGSQHPSGSGEVHRHRVDVYARDGEAQPFQHIFGIKGLSLGRFDEVGDRLGDEGP